MSPTDTVVRPPSFEEVCGCLYGITSGSHNFTPDTREDFEKFLAANESTRWYGTPVDYSRAAYNCIADVYDALHLVCCGAERCASNPDAIKRFWARYIELADGGWSSGPKAGWPDGLEAVPPAGDGPFLCVKCEEYEPDRRRWYLESSEGVRITTGCVGSRNSLVADAQVLGGLEGRNILLYRGDGALHRVIDVEPIEGAPNWMDVVWVWPTPQWMITLGGITAESERFYPVDKDKAIARAEEIAASIGRRVYVCTKGEYVRPVK